MYINRLYLYTLRSIDREATFIDVSDLLGHDSISMRNLAFLCFQSVPSLPRESLFGGLKRKVSAPKCFYFRFWLTRACCKITHVILLLLFT